MSEPLVIPEDLKKVCPLCKGEKQITYDDIDSRELGECYACQGTGEVWILTRTGMAERIARAEAEVATLRSQVERLYEALEGALSFQTKKQRSIAAALIAARKEAGK